MWSDLEIRISFAGTYILPSFAVIILRGFSHRLFGLRLAESGGTY